MKTKLLLFLVSLLAMGGSLSAQSWSGRSSGDARVTNPYRLCVGEDNGQDVCMTQSAANIAKIVNGSLDFALVSKTVSTLPPAAANAGRVYRVTDGTTSSDCTVGGGSTSAVCVSNGASWQNLGGAGGGSSAGTPLQKGNGAGGFSNSGVTESGTTLNVADDSHFKGPNPYFDITQYGAAYCGNSGNACPSTTGTMGASSSSLSLAAASTFVNGEGIKIPGAGPTVTLSTPSAPAVAAASVATAMGTGTAIANTTGSATVQYQVVAFDNLDGYTLPSSATSISNGPSTFGGYSVNISSCTRSNNTVTVNTSSNHGLVQFEKVSITGAGCSIANAGLYHVATVPSGTQFTFTDGNDTRAGASASGGASGTVTAVNFVQVSVTHVANARAYCIYGRTSGAMNLIGYTLPDNTSSSVTGDPLYNIFDDYGPTYTPNLSNSAVCPLTPPGSAKNDDLITTITAGGGTTTLTLANPSTNAVSGVTIQIDNNVPFVNAVLAAAKTNGQVGVVYIPSTPQNATFPFNSFVNIGSDILSPNTVSIMQAGIINLADTMKLGPAKWIGWTQNPIFSDSFWFEALPVIQSTTAYPMLWSTQNIDMSYIALKSYQGASQAVFIWLADGTGGIPSSMISHVGFSSGSASPDLLSVHYGMRSSAAGDAHQIMEYVAFTPGSAGGNFTDTPLVLYSRLGGTPFTFSHVQSTKRTTLYFGGTIQAYISDFYTQGSLVPDFILANVLGGNTSASLDIHDVTKDTTNTPLVNYFNGVSGRVSIEGANGPQNLGLVGTGGMYLDVKATVGVPVVPSTNSGTDLEAQALEGIQSTNVSSNIGIRQENREIIIGPMYKAAVTAPPPAAPGLTATGSGGTISPGAHSITVAQVFSDNSEGPQSPAASVTISAGQNINITATPQDNAIGWDIYDGGGSIQCNSPLVTPGSALNFTWTGANPAKCGQSAPTAAAGGPNSIDNNATRVQQLVMTGSPGYTTTLTNPSNTANRAVTYPDSAGTQGIVTGATTAGHCIQAGTVTGAMSDSGAACGGMANPMTTLGDIIYENNTPAPARLGGCTYAVGVPCTFVETPTSGPTAAAPSWVVSGITPRSVSTASDTILNTDRSNKVRYTDSAATTQVAVTVPQAGTSGFDNGFVFSTSVDGSDSVLFTPTTSTITYNGVSGLTTFVQVPGETCTWTSAGGNYAVDGCGPSASGVNASYVLSVHQGYTVARPRVAGQSRYTNTDSAVVINSVLGTNVGGIVYFKNGVYNLNSATQETSSGCSNFYSIGIPANAYGSFVQWHFEGESRTSWPGEIAGAGIQTNGAILNLTASAITAAGSSFLATVWQRPNNVGSICSGTPNLSGSAVFSNELYFKNITCRWPNNSRGNGGCFLPWAAGSVDYENVLADINVAYPTIASGSTPTAGAGGFYGIASSYSSSGNTQHFRDTYVTGYYYGYDFESEHVVGDTVTAIYCRTPAIFGNQGTSVFHPSVITHFIDQENLTGIVFGSNMLQGSRVDLFGLDMEFGSSNWYARTSASITENNPGYTSGIITYTAVLQGTGVAAEAPDGQLFNGSGGANFQVFEGTTAPNIAKVPAQDTFTRANSSAAAGTNGLGPQWLAGTQTGNKNLTIASNAAQVNQTGAATGYSNYAAQLFIGDQFSKATVNTIDSSSSTFVEVLVDSIATASVQTYYSYYCSHVAAGGSGILKVVAGASTTLASQTASVGCNAGDVLELRHIGTTLWAYRNGILDSNFTNPVTDSSITSGSPGIEIAQDATAGATITNWQGGSFPVQHPGTDSIYGNAGYHLTYNTLTNCNPGSSVSPAACGSAPSGTVVVPTTTTTYTVNSTAVTKNSRIVILPITDNTGLTGAPTCVAPPTPFIAYESGRVAGTSFSFTLPSTTGASCWTYDIKN